MLTGGALLPGGVLAHAGEPPAPHDLWGAWNADPLLLVAGGLVVAAYARGRGAGRRRLVDDRRAWAFAGAVLALAVALVSPLDALSSALASAHMVQHVLLVLVAAPLLAASAPSGAVVRGSPPALRHAVVRWRRRLGLGARAPGVLRRPEVVWVLHVATLWWWHAAVPYDAAVDHEALHVLEHASFLATGVLFWHVVLGGRRADRVPHGVGILLVSTMGMQSVVLSLLLSFARAPWYTAYLETTAAWGLDPLQDQQLAGAIMWVPAGTIYVVATLGLLVAWLHASERDALPG